MVVRAVNWYRFDCDVKSCNKHHDGVMMCGTETSPDEALEDAARRVEQAFPGWRIITRPYPPYANAFCPDHAKLLDTED